MRHFQFSLRWLLGATALVALGCTALLNATTLWESLFVSFTLVMLVTAVVLAAYTRAATRAFWVGFCIFGWGYFLIAHLGSLAYSSANRYDGHSELVTTRLLELVYEHGIPLVRTPSRPTYLLPPPPPGTYTPPTTFVPPTVDAERESAIAVQVCAFDKGNKEADDDLPSPLSVMPLAPTPAQPSWPTPPPLPPSGIAYPADEKFMGLMTTYPEYTCFVLIGHCLWTIFFANVGGRFARFLYDRNIAAASMEGRT